MKKLTSIVAITAFIFAAFSVKATNINDVPSLGINSANSTTNIVQNGLWPSSLPASSTLTNITAFPVSGGTHAFFQFVASATTTNGGNVTYTIGRNNGAALLVPSTPSQIAGQGIEWFSTFTQTLPANTATTATTSCTNFYDANGGGGVGTFYIGIITTPANVILTNYSVSLKVK